MKRLTLPALLFAFAAVVSPLANAQTPGTERWEFATGGAIHSSPAIADDGTIYVGSLDKKLYAVNPGGTKKWEFLTKGGVESPPTIGPDGTIYIGSDDGTLYSISPDGTNLWTFAVGAPVVEPPAVGTDGTLYLSSPDGKLYALNSNGSIKWQVSTGGAVPAPSLGPDGTIYVGNLDANLYALNSDGSLKWKFYLGANYAVRTSVAIDLEGTAYFTADGNGIVPGVYTRTCYGLAPDGTKRFATTSTTGEVALGQTGQSSRIYGGKGGAAVAVSTNGVTAWSHGLNPQVSGFSVTTAPALASDGTIYVGTDLKILFALNADGTETWRFTTGGKIYSSPSIDTNGTVYFGSEDGNLYAVNGSAPLAPTAWPMYGRDTKHTSTVPNPPVGETVLDLAMYPGISIKGNVGSSYRVEYSGNASNPFGWQALATVTLDRTPYFFVDLNAAKAGQRFYRAILVP